MDTPTHSPRLRVVLVKPSKYGLDGAVERFRRGFMPNATLRHVASLTPQEVAGHGVELHTVDEYVECDLGYLQLLERDPACTTVLALVGVQTHQFHRALDLAAYARAHGVRHVVIGGPHPMTMDTSMIQGRGVSFALAEAELIWLQILADAVAGELQPVYGDQDAPWQEVLDPPALIPPQKRDLRRYVVPMLGVYPARGCPYRCNFCSVIQIAGRQVRSQPVETTMATLRAAQAAGVLLIMFTTDNFNKYAEAETLLQAIIDERLNLRILRAMRHAGGSSTPPRRAPRARRLLSDVRRRGVVQPRDVAGGEEEPEPPGALPRAHRDVPCAWHRPALFEHHRFPERHRGRNSRPSAHPARAAARSGVVLHSDAVGRAIRRLPRRRTSSPSGTWIATMRVAPTWRHPHISNERLVDLLFHCYSEFYRDIEVPPPDQLAKMARWPERNSAHSLTKISSERFAVFSKLAVAARRHPMAGGVFEARCDHLDDYIELRRRLYGFDIAPPPRMLRPTVEAHWPSPTAQDAVGL